MKYYLNDIKYYPATSPFLKSIGKIMASCSTATYLLSYFYAGTRFFTKFLLSDCGTSTHIFLSGLLPGIFFTSVILILST